MSGVKTGHTLGAGYVLSVPARAGGGRVITVTLGAPSEAARDADTLALLRWGLEQFQRERVLRAGRALARGRRPKYRDGDARRRRPPVHDRRRSGGRAGPHAGGHARALEGPLPTGERVGWVDGESLRGRACAASRS